MRLKYNQGVRCRSRRLSVSTFLNRPEGSTERILGALAYVDLPCDFLPLAHVLLSIEAYRRLAGLQESIIDLLADPEAADVSFEPDRLGSLTRPADLS